MKPSSGWLGSKHQITNCWFLSWTKSEQYGLTWTVKHQNSTESVQAKQLPLSFSRFPPVTETKVETLFWNQQLNSIPNPLLFECLDETLSAITHVINSSLRSAIFPSVDKTAVVKPLLKKPSLDQNDLKSYRPLSTLSFISKIFEKIGLSLISISTKMIYSATLDLHTDRSTALRPSC